MYVNIFLQSSDFCGQDEGESPEKKNKVTPTKGWFQNVRNKAHQQTGRGGNKQKGNQRGQGQLEDVKHQNLNRQNSHNIQRNQNIQQRGGHQRRHFRQPQQDADQKNDFKAFDYSRVDFNQFQGGAGSAKGGDKFKSEFRGKVIAFLFTEVGFTVLFF